jgi:hypothetical protein
LTRISLKVSGSPTHFLEWKGGSVSIAFDISDTFHTSKKGNKNTDGRRRVQTREQIGVESDSNITTDSFEDGCGLIN